MDDLISRQAAIDALLKAKDKGELHRRLIQLPTAQPEIIRCKDCEFYKKEFGFNGIEYMVCGISPTHNPIRVDNDFCSKAERRNGWEE